MLPFYAVMEEVAVEATDPSVEQREEAATFFFCEVQELQ
jgi:hypothetical protein